MTTKDKLEFCFLMARNSKATVTDCQRLMHFASTLQRINDDDAETQKKIRVQRKVLSVCACVPVDVQFLRNGAINIIASGHVFKVPA